MASGMEGDGGARSKMTPGLKRKVAKVLSIRVDSPELMEALTELSEFYGENTAANRAALRTTVERRGMRLMQEVVDEFCKATSSIEEVSKEVDVLEATVTRMADAIAACRGSTGDLLEESRRLQAELDTVNAKEEASRAFLERFTLSPEDEAALAPPGGDAGAAPLSIGPEFFRALGRLRNIQGECRQLLRTDQQRMGLDIMDAMAATQEAAYERLYRWAQAQCRSLGGTTSASDDLMAGDIEVDDLLAEALRALKERPVLYRYCVEEVARTRHNALFRRFIAALTRGGPNGHPRPIEMHAHDPQRYVGDMCAWLHQNVASEIEAIRSVFNVTQGGSGDGDQGENTEAGADAVVDANGAGSARENGDVGQHGGGNGGDGEPSTSSLDAAVEEDVGALRMEDVLDNVFEGICRPFRVRIEQIFAGQPSLAESLRLNYLLSFYAGLVEEMLSAGSPLCTTLRACEATAYEAFDGPLKSANARLLAAPPPPPGDLGVPRGILDALQRAVDVFVAYEGRLIRPDDGPDNIEEVLDNLLGPLSDTVRKAATGVLAGEASGTASKKCAEAVFILNCLHDISQPLTTRDFTAAWVQRIAGDIEACVETVQAEEARGVLERTGMWGKREALLGAVDLHRQAASQGSQMPAMQSMPGLSGAEIQQTLDKFYELLSQGGALSLPVFDRIQNARLRSRARAAVAESLAEAHKDLFETVMDPAHGYTNPMSILRHTPATLRSIMETS